MLPPRKWLLSLGLLAAAPVAAMAGPFDVFKPKPKPKTAATTPARSNQEVAEEIASALREARLVGKDIDIEFKSGVARLSGQIADERQRAIATRVVSEVPGVRSVENRLKIMPGAPRTFSSSPIQQAGYQGDGRQHIQRVQFEEPTEGNFASLFQGESKPAAPAGNQAVAQQIAEAVQNTGLTDYDIEIRYKDGVATLIGAVDNAHQAIAANEATAKVPGVKRVVNRLTVRGRPFSMKNRSTPQQPEPLAQFQPYPNAQAAQLAMQQRMSPQQQPLSPQQQRAIQQASAQGANPHMTPPPVPQQAYQQTGFHGRHHMGVPGGYPPPGPHMVYNRPNLPEHAWPAQAPYDNYAAVSYPSQYDASAWPYIGPFYPYPQVPMGWRSAQLVWDDGYWNLKFNSRTDKWWWFLSPKNWH